MKVKIVTAILVLLISGDLFSQNPADIAGYISNYREIAIAEMQRSGIPASIILAQGIHESEAGTSELVHKSNNHFGIKCKDSWTGPVVYHDDDRRGECFRSYDNPVDSYRDHSDFLKSSPRYAFLFNIDPQDYQSWAYGLKKAGYATNQRYPQILIKLIEDYGLQQYTLMALGKAVPDSMQKALTAPVEMVATPPVASSMVIQPAERKFKPSEVINPAYPQGTFTINHSRVIFARSGTSLLAVANQYNMSLGRLLEFNELSGNDVLERDQLLFLQPKKRFGEAPYHIVQAGETAYDICQQEGIRFENLLELNLMDKNMEPAPGEKLFLRHPAGSRPLLLTEKDKKQPDAPGHAPQGPAAGTSGVREIRKF